MNFLDVWSGDFVLNNANKWSNDKHYWSVLNEQEKARALTFTRQDLQKKYIKMRAVLKHILSKYMHVNARQVVISTAKYGKPFIETTHDLHFNVSDKGNRFVIAVSNIDPVGIDIEQERVRQNLPALVKKCFSEKEAQFYFSLPQQQQTSMFYRFWVRKEAYVKAVGRGISLGLKQCVIDPTNHAHFLSLPSSCGLGSDWRIVDVRLNHDDICAVVTKNIDFEWRQIQWQETS